MTTKIILLLSGAALVVALSACGTAVPPAPAASSAPPATATATAAVAPPVAAGTTTARPTTKKSTPSTSKNKADTSSGCGKRAMAAGKFNPSCKEYQGYLDPGSSADRGKSSGEIQSEDHGGLTDSDPGYRDANGETYAEYCKRTHQPLDTCQAG